MNSSCAPAQLSDLLAPTTFRTGLVVRLRLTGRDTVSIVTALAIGVLLCGWLVIAAGAALTVFLPLLLPATGLVRTCCDAQRRRIADQTGRPLRSPYRRLDGHLVQRALTVCTDPATWRDAAWMLWQSLAGWVMAALTVSLLLGSVFYLTYPVWYAAAPPPVFREPFGPWSELHSTAESCALIPVSVVCFALWYAITLPMARAQATVGRALLAPR